jgi:hypothetical protein
MNKTLIAPFAAIAALSLPKALSADDQPMTLEQGADRVLASDQIAWDFVEGLTTEVGPRQAGTEAEARGRAWATAWLNKMGFQNVADEPFEMDTWVPGDIWKAHVTAPFPQELIVQPLGNSAATPKGGVEAEVVYFPTVAELMEAPEGSLKGKIAFISPEMRPAQDGSHYGFAGPARWVGAGIAASKGAVDAFVMNAAKDLGPQGIRICGLRPGMTRTEMLEEIGGDATIAAGLPTIPLGRAADPQEIAEAAVFLASAKASYIHGTTIDVTGGR